MLGKYHFQCVHPGNTSLHVWKLTEQTEYANPSSIKEHHVGAVNLLYHFHYVNKGSLPFELALHPTGIQELTRASELMPDQVEFIFQTALLVKERGK